MEDLEVYYGDISIMISSCEKTSVPFTPKWSIGLAKISLIRLCFWLVSPPASLSIYSLEFSVPVFILFVGGVFSIQCVFLKGPILLSQGVINPASRKKASRPV